MSNSTMNHTNGGSLSQKSITLVDRNANELIKQFENLKEEFNDLLLNKNRVFHKYVEKYNKIVEQQKKKNRFIHNEEIKATERIFESEKHQIECDFDNEVKLLQSHFYDYLLRKCDGIYQKFPNAHKYFLSKGYVFNFKGLRDKTPLPVAPNYVATDSEEQLIPAKHVKDAIKLYDFKRNEVPGLSKDRLGKVNIQISEHKPVECEIAGINDEDILFLVDGVKFSVNIPTLAATNSCFK